MVALSLLLLPFLGSIAFAGQNNWARPCTKGECFYDLPKKSPSAPSGTLRIWGSPNAIADITPAAGWIILGCDPNALAQNIRLVCMSDESDPEGCGHLFRAKRAANKIVRLPEECGGSPFARIARAYVDADQRIPASIERRLVRRDGAPAIVYGLMIDTSFAAINPEETGEVEMELEGVNVHLEEEDAGLVSPSGSFHSTRLAQMQDRGLIDWVENKFNKWNNWDKSISKNLTPLDVDKSYNLFDLSVSCPANGGNVAFYATLKADLKGKAHTTILIGVAAKGTVIPPKIKEFGIFAEMNGFINGKFVLAGTVSGVAETGPKTIFETGVPGFSFPGILTVGPSFKVQAKAKATLDIDVNLTVDISYTLTDAQLFWPKSNLPSGGEFSPGTNELKLAVNPSLASRATVEAHLIPRVDIGITAFGGIAKATIFLNLDASADATLTLAAGGSVGASTGFAPSLIHPTFAPPPIEMHPSITITSSAPAPTITLPPTSDLTLPPSLTLTNPGFPPIVIPTPVLSLPWSHKDAETEKRANSWYVNGCVDINAHLSINAGADAAFFGLFDASTQVSIINESWDIYENCWGSFAKRGELPEFHALGHLHSRSLSCQTSASSELIKLI